MTEDKYEGCGIGKIWLITDTRFYPACVWHDEAYSEGSFEQKNLTRKQVDDKFLHEMLFASHTWWQRTRAYAAYYLVRAVGWLWWEGR